MYFGSRDQIKYYERWSPVPVTRSSNADEPAGSGSI
jgi:hypothetical protein